MPPRFRNRLPPFPNLSPPSPVFLVPLAVRSWLETLTPDQVDVFAVSKDPSVRVRLAAANDWQPISTALQTSTDAALATIGSAVGPAALSFACARQAGVIRSMADVAWMPAVPSLVRYLLSPQTTAKPDVDHLTDRTEFAFRASIVELKSSVPSDICTADTFLTNPLQNNLPAVLACRTTEFECHLRSVGPSASAVIDFALTDAGFVIDTDPSMPVRKQPVRKQPKKTTDVEESDEDDDESKDDEESESSDEDDEKNPISADRSAALLFAAQVLHRSLVAAMRPLVAEQHTAAADGPNNTIRSSGRFRLPPCVGMTRNEVAAIPEPPDDGKKSAVPKKKKKSKKDPDDIVKPVPPPLTKSLSSDFRWKRLDADHLLWLLLTAKDYNRYSTFMYDFNTNAIRTTRGRIVEYDAGLRQILNSASQRKQKPTDDLIPLSPERMYGFPKSAAESIRKDARKAVWSFVCTDDLTDRIIRFCDFMTANRGKIVYQSTALTPNEKSLIMRTLLALPAALSKPVGRFAVDTVPPPFDSLTTKRVFLARCALAMIFPMPSIPSVPTTTTTTIGAFFQGAPNTAVRSECSLSCLLEWIHATWSLGDRTLVGTPLSAVVARRLSEQDRLNRSAMSLTKLLGLTNLESRSTLRQIISDNIVVSRRAWLETGNDDDDDDTPVIVDDRKSIRPTDNQSKPTIKPEPVDASGQPLPLGRHHHLGALVENLFGHDRQNERLFDFVQLLICADHGIISKRRSYDHEIGPVCDATILAGRTMTLADVCEQTTRNLANGRSSVPKTCPRDGCRHVLVSQVIPPVLARFSFRYNNREDAAADRSDSKLYAVSGTGAQAIAPESIGAPFLFGGVRMEPTGLLFGSDGHFRAMLRFDPSSSSSSLVSTAAEWYAFDDLLSTDQQAWFPRMPLWPRDAAATDHPGGGKLCCVGPAPRFGEFDDRFSTWRQSDILFLLARRVPATTTTTTTTATTTIKTEPAPIVVTNAASAAAAAAADRARLASFSADFTAKAAMAARMASTSIPDQKKTTVKKTTVPVVDTTGWICAKCSLLNADDRMACAGCNVRRKRKSAEAAKTAVALTRVLELTSNICTAKAAEKALLKSGGNPDRAAASLMAAYSAKYKIDPQTVIADEPKAAKKRKPKSKRKSYEDDDSDDDYTDAKTVESEDDDDESSNDDDDGSNDDDGEKKTMSDDDDDVGGRKKKKKPKPTTTKRMKPTAVLPAAVSSLPVSSVRTAPPSFYSTTAGHTVPPVPNPHPSVKASFRPPPSSFRPPPPPSSSTGNIDRPTAPSIHPTGFRLPPPSSSSAAATSIRSTGFRPPPVRSTSFRPPPPVRLTDFRPPSSSFIPPPPYRPSS